MRILWSGLRRRHAGLLAIALGLSVGSPAAQAQTSRPQSDRPTIATLLVPLDAGAQAEVTRLEPLTFLAEYQSVRFSPLRMLDALDSDGAKLRAQKEAEAAQALAAGTRAYNDLDAATAQAQFDRAMRAFERTDLSRTFERFTQAWVMKIAAQVANGENRAAQKEIERLLAVNPRAEFPKAFFPPDQIAYAEKVRRLQSNAGISKLEVRTIPVPAEIYVDGQFRGTSPVTVRGLTPGDHFLTALATGFAIAQERVRDGARELVLPPAVGETAYHSAIKRIAANPRQRERDTAALEFGRFLHADQVLVALLQKSPAGNKLDATVLRLDSADGHNHGYAEGTVALDSSLPSAWNVLVTQTLFKDAPRNGGDPVHHFESVPWTSQSTGYTLLAGGGALIAGSVVLGLVAKSKADAFQALPQTSPDAPAVAKSGKTFAVVADVAGLAGLVSAGVGAFLAITGGSHDAAPAPRHSEDLPMPPPPMVKPPAYDDGPRRGDDDARRRADEDARRRSDEDARSRSDEDARRRTDADAKRRADEDARRRADEDSRRRAAADAKRRADEDARRRADEDARRRADGDAKRRADADAKRRADEDARRRADEDARRRADADAKHRAGQDAKTRTDAEAKRRADEEQKKRDDAERAKREEEEKRKRDEQKHKQEQEEDLRNF